MNEQYSLEDIIKGEYEIVKNIANETITTLDSRFKYLVSKKSVTTKDNKQMDLFEYINQHYYSNNEEVIFYIKYMLYFAGTTGNKIMLKNAKFLADYLEKKYEIKCHESDLKKEYEKGRNEQLVKELKTKIFNSGYSSLNLNNFESIKTAFYILGYQSSDWQIDKNDLGIIIDNFGINGTFNKDILIENYKKGKVEKLTRELFEKQGIDLDKIKKQDNNTIEFKTIEEVFYKLGLSDNKVNENDLEIIIDYIKDNFGINVTFDKDFGINVTFDKYSLIRSYKTGRFERSTGGIIKNSEIEISEKVLTQEKNIRKVFYKLGLSDNKINGSDFEFIICYIAKTNSANSNNTAMIEYRKGRFEKLIGKLFDKHNIRICNNSSNDTINFEIIKKIFYELGLSDNKVDKNDLGIIINYIQDNFKIDGTFNKDILIENYEEGIRAKEKEKENKIEITNGGYGKIIKKGYGQEWKDREKGYHFSFECSNGNRKVEYICDYNPDSKDNSITISKKGIIKNGTYERISINKEEITIDKNKLLEVLKEALKKELEKNKELSSKLENKNSLEEFFETYADSEEKNRNTAGIGGHNP